MAGSLSSSAEAGGRKPRDACTTAIEFSELLRSEEHTSELQSPDHLVCRLLLEKKKTSTARSIPDAGLRLVAVLTTRLRLGVLCLRPQSPNQGWCQHPRPTSQLHLNRLSVILPQ